MCLFCDINDNKIPSKTIYEDDKVKCFLDLNQDDLGHTLIVPKTHTDDINTIDKDSLSYVFEIAKKLQNRIENKLQADGFSFTINYGIAQEIKHFHLHLIPKYKNKPDVLEVEKLYEILKED